MDRTQLIHYMQINTTSIYPFSDCMKTHFVMSRKQYFSSLRRTGTFAECCSTYETKCERELWWRRWTHSIRRKQACKLVSLNTLRSCYEIVNISILLETVPKWIMYIFGCPYYYPTLYLLVLIVGMFICLMFLLLSSTK